MCVLESLLFRAKGAARDDGRPAGRRGKEIGADRRGTENARRDRTERVGGARRRARRTEGSGRRDVFKDADAGRQA